MWHFLRRLLARSAAGVVLALLILLVPLPAISGQVQQAVGVILLVCTIGKALYDTLFYDRYWP